MILIHTDLLKSIPKKYVLYAWKEFNKKMINLCKNSKGNSFIFGYPKKFILNYAKKLKKECSKRKIVIDESEWKKFLYYLNQNKHRFNNFEDMENDWNDSEHLMKNFLFFLNRYTEEKITRKEFSVIKNRFRYLTANKKIKDLAPKEDDFLPITDESMQDYNQR